MNTPPTALSMGCKDKKRLRDNAKVLGGEHGRRGSGNPLAVPHSLPPQGLHLHKLLTFLQSGFLTQGTINGGGRLGRHFFFKKRDLCLFGREKIRQPSHPHLLLPMYFSLIKIRKMSQENITWYQVSNPNLKIRNVKWPKIQNFENQHDPQQVENFTPENFVSYIKLLKALYTIACRLCVEGMSETDERHALMWVLAPGFLIIWQIFQNLKQETLLVPSISSERNAPGKHLGLCGPLQHRSSQRQNPNEWTVFRQNVTDALLSWNSCSFYTPPKTILFICFQLPENHSELLGQ